MEYIRKATPEDAERIRYIADQCWWLASGEIEAQKTIRQVLNDFYSHGNLTNEINNNISVFLLVIDEELPVAFTSYTLKKGNVNTCEINAMYCLPETQGKRFDELLVREVTKNTIAEGGNEIFVVLTDYNGPSAMFERLGFKPLKKNVQKKLNSEICIMRKNIGSFPK